MPMLNVKTPQVSLEAHNLLVGIINFDVFPSYAIINMFTLTMPFKEDEEEEEEEAEEETQQEGQEKRRQRRLEGAEEPEPETDVSDDPSSESQRPCSKEEERCYWVPERYDKMGYGTLSIIDNMGFLFVVLFFTTIGALIFFLFHWGLFHFVPEISYKYRVFHRKMHTNIFWGFFLRTLLEIYLETSMGALINLKHLSNETHGDRFNNLIVFLALAVCGLFPVWVIYFICRYGKG